jgi:aerobic carbon-monoxide dehydrogenase small subunit
MTSSSIKVTINGEAYQLVIEPNRSLLDILRNEVGLTGTKKGCDVGDCGACTVIMDGKLVNSCLVLGVEADGTTIETIEGLATLSNGKVVLHPLQASFLEHGAVQCGFCTPGMIMSAKVLLDGNPKPTEEEVRFALAGNICRCTGFTKIVEAVVNSHKHYQVGETT